MNSKQFDEIVERRLKLIRETLVEKAKEYASDKNRLHNFYAAAHIRGCSPVEALQGMLVKHTVSVDGMLKSGKPYPHEKWDEKLGDIINYHILLEALLIDTGASTGKPSFPPEENYEPAGDFPLDSRQLF